MLFRGENGNNHCSWCHYLSCVPTSEWNCRNQWKFAIRLELPIPFIFKVPILFPPQLIYGIFNSFIGLLSFMHACIFILNCWHRESNVGSSIYVVFPLYMNYRVIIIRQCISIFYSLSLFSWWLRLCLFLEIVLWWNFSLYEILVGIVLWPFQLSVGLGFACSFLK